MASHGKFTKGVGAPRGNTNACKENRRWSDAINRALAQGGAHKLRDCADALINAAAKGDVPALRELGDRIDGKVAQVLESKGNLVIVLNNSDADL